MNALLTFLNHVFIERLDLWVLLGFVAQAMFTGRFLVQWIASERAKRSVVPVAFWTFSLAGGALLLVYALHRKDPVFILGQAAGLFIYARNLFLIAGEKKRNLAATAAMDLPATAQR
ncbi:lipid-A-disaccharide synthase N-terminal domain-containing protein [Jiella sp. M17.18]|uniref:lipid-A-disaccharide synthase N-terminal domain-containing protein n=1 Tax=Jiella sp. M17.18 TaxID=3234247 RepID=UPI0034DE503B